MRIKKFNFGTSKSGIDVFGFEIKNDKGVEFSVINWGATIISLKMPDKSGNVENCTLGFDNFTEYENYSPYFGSTIGRTGNRIADGRCKIDGKEYKFNKNENEVTHLHGGSAGFDKVIWDITPFEKSDNAGIICSYLSQDGEENYPGNLKVVVTYTLNKNNEFTIDYKAETDKTTLVNLTNHTYWNLSGNRKENISNHSIQIDADSYLPINKLSIPTGQLKDVKGTDFDFKEIKNLKPLLDKTGGYDHNFNLSLYQKEKPENRTLLLHKESGRSMEILTTEPGIQFYTGNYLFLLKKQGFDIYDALCLETQKYPDAPNHEDFQTWELKPGEKYTHTTVYKFSIIK